MKNSKMLAMFGVAAFFTVLLIKKGLGTDDVKFWILVLVAVLSFFKGVHLMFKNVNEI